MYDDDGFGPEEENRAAKRKPLPQMNQQGPLFFIIIGIVLGFLIATFFSASFPGFGAPSQFDGIVTNVDKYYSSDLRTVKVILRVNDANLAVCSDGDNCLGYQIGDSVSVTCLGSDCQATKK